MSSRSSIGQRPVYRIPVFGLYGSAEEPKGAGYAHVETIAARAERNDWEIGAHRHIALAQCLVIQNGEGLLDLEGQQSTFAAPWFLWLPSGVVHGFRFAPSTIGHVLTVSDDVVSAALRQSGDLEALSEIVSVPFHARVPDIDEIGVGVTEAIIGIENELLLPRSAIGTAIAAKLLLIIVALLRARTLLRLDDGLGKARASEFRRFRAIVESDFRQQRSIRSIAAELGITSDKLHNVTTQAVGKPPLEIIHDRIILECKRELAYTDKRIAVIGFDCGFADAAHFSRFFSDRVGVSPRGFRRLARASDPG
ncbi:HpaA, 4-hydroxyphenylacetate catabolism regulatory protein HpaA [Rhabdaerophilaceae bacterium]